MLWTRSQHLAAHCKMSHVQITFYRHNKTPYFLSKHLSIVNQVIMYASIQKQRNMFSWIVTKHYRFWHNSQTIMNFPCFHQLKAIKCNRHLRGDGNLGLRLLFNLLQVPALLPDQSSDQTVVGQDLQRNILSSTEARPQVGNHRDVFKEVPWLQKIQTYTFVSSASFCMMSMIMRHVAEQPSGVEWMVIGFSAAPAFSLRWMSTLSGSEIRQSFMRSCQCHQACV